MDLEILYEDNHLIAVNKSNSDLVQGDETGDEALNDKVKAYLKQKYNKPGNVFLGVVHRLDRPVSGVVLFARTSKALSRMNKLFQEKEVKKTYWAIVKNLPPDEEGQLKHFILKDSIKNKSYALHKKRPGSKEGILNYRLISSSANYHLLEVDLKTGRHHQIRCQLAKIGCPIKGDLKYGFPRSNPNGGISLHSRRLEFVHPIKKEVVVIEAPVPVNEPLWNAFENVII
ncbi:RluA family pseudouridine synthase [Thermophagus xiamenensis]|uniref:23S rRNA pseudouridine1911/1915/1917 synthase n=1 Tax=Thermophagus xiamenensis TaxID=385682 RepID=A0A1I2FEN7_9BACT|nr:RluA family pseudouridine synthase [Thermophagus xiamenensis]SFF03463.1 23S rRNA pseudouridine1911/1915/1917 synthase [Thermophagus xiamenensis]